MIVCVFGPDTVKHYPLDLLHSATACIIWFFFTFFLIQTSNPAQANGAFRDLSIMRGKFRSWKIDKVYKNIWSFYFHKLTFFLTPATFFEVAKHFFYKVSVFASFLTYCQIAFREHRRVRLRFCSTRKSECSRALCHPFCLLLGYCLPRRDVEMPQRIEPNRFGDNWRWKVPVSIVTDQQLCPGLRGLLPLCVQTEI